MIFVQNSYSFSFAINTILLYFVIGRNVCTLSIKEVQLCSSPLARRSPYKCFFKCMIAKCRNVAKKKYFSIWIPHYMYRNKYNKLIKKPNNKYHFLSKNCSLPLFSQLFWLFFLPCAAFEESFKSVFFRTEAPE